MTEIGKYLLSLFITPSVRYIVLAIFEVCALQFINSYIVSPRKLNVVTLSILVSQIIKTGISLAESADHKIVVRGKVMVIIGIWMIAVNHVKFELLQLNVQWVSPLYNVYV